jgi:1-acyl-sn-glycerol-3-phosphate acyltransferase
MAPQGRLGGLEVLKSLYSLWFWWVFATWGFFTFFTILVTMPVVSRRQTWALGGAMFRILFRLWGIRWRVEGESHCDGRPALLMPNHVNMFDHFLLIASGATLPTIGIEKAKNFKLPIYGAMMRRWGSVPIEAGGGAERAKAVSDAAREVMARDGVDLLTFPEGTRSRDGRVHGFKKGGFHIAIELGAPLQPITILGSQEVMLGGDWRVWPGAEVVMVFHPRIETAGRGKDEIPALMAEVRRAVLSRLPSSLDALAEGEPTPSLPQPIGAAAS